jgi:hypothetical protein
MSQESFFFPSCGFLTFEPGRPVAILPSALLVERFSLGAWWAFLIQQVLLPDKRPLFRRFCGSWAPGVRRSHLDSAVELSCADRNSLGHGAHRFLAIAQWFVHLSAYPQPM